MTKNTVAHHIISTLISQGVDNFYCLPGVQNDDFFDTLYDYQDHLPPIHTRHEQGCAYMALGAGLATGKPQVFCIVPGPGFLNSTSALATAYSTNTPVLALIGHIPSGAIDKGIGLLHEIPQQTEILSFLTKKTHIIRSGQGAKSLINDAFTALQSGNPQPVGLEIPVNVWNQDMSDADMDIPITAKQNPVLNSNKVAHAISLIKSAKKPMIFVGSGAQDSSKSITKFAESIHAPVVANRMGHGVMSRKNPLSVPNPVGHKLWADTDLVIALGSRLQQRMMWGVDGNIKTIQVDLNPAQQTIPPIPADIFIHGDCGDFVKQVLPHVSDKQDTENWRVHVADVKQAFFDKINVQLAPQIGYLNAIRNALPEDGIYVEELTQCGFVGRIAFPTYKPRTFISHGYQGTLGWGLATALGVAHARRDVPVVSISGDGGFMFTMCELATAIHHNIPLNIVVFNDNAFGNVKRFQIDNYNNRPIASDLTNPDFIKMAESFGISATRVHTPQELQQHLKQDMHINAPTFIEVTIDDNLPSPWEHILMPKVRG